MYIFLTIIPQICTPVCIFLKVFLILRIYGIQGLRAGDSLSTHLEIIGTDTGISEFRPYPEGGFYGILHVC